MFYNVVAQQNRVMMFFCPSQLKSKSIPLCPLPKLRLFINVCVCLYSGNYQSPVNIEPEDADVDEGLEGNPLIFKYIPKNTKGITNNGALMRIDVDGTDSCKY